MYDPHCVMVLKVFEATLSFFKQWLKVLKMQFFPVGPMMDKNLEITNSV